MNNSNSEYTVIGIRRNNGDGCGYGATEFYDTYVIQRLFDNKVLYSNGKWDNLSFAGCQEYATKAEAEAIIKALMGV